MENTTHSSKGRKAVEQELLRGSEIANHLHEVLVHQSKSNKEEGSILQFVEDLVHQVLRSFTNSLLLLNTNCDDVSDEVVLPTKIGDFSSSPSSDTKSRMGRYKRKSTVPNWEKDSPILTEDGHEWRKYGQKKTTNSKYLRHYYRCTHKLDQGCPAIKQVQQIQEDPPLYRTTYIDHHNCKSSYINHEIFVESDSFPGSSVLLSFNNSIPNKEHPFSSPVFKSTKQEPVEVIHDDHIAHNRLSLSDYILLGDYELDSNDSRHVDRLSSTDDTIQFDNVYGGSLDFDALAVSLNKILIQEEMERQLVTLSWDTASLEFSFLNYGSLLIRGTE